MSRAARFCLLGLIVSLPCAGQSIRTFAGGGTDDGRPATAAGLGQPYGVAVDAVGNLYIADTYNNRIRKVAVDTGIISTIAGNGSYAFSGDGGPASAAGFKYPRGVALDTAGNLYVADSNNGSIRKVAAATGIISTVAGTGTYGFSGDGGPATAARLSPVGVAADAVGNIYVADAGNYRVRKVDAATGIISTFAGTGAYSFSGDGGPATAAGLNAAGVALDTAGNVYIADAGNSRIRKVNAATGIISTVAGGGSGALGDGGPATAATLWQPNGVALDGTGNIYIADTSLNRIRRVEAANGTISTVAGNGTQGFAGDGGPATLAALWLPYGVAVDASGNVYLSDRQHNRVRKVASSTGIISTAAGSGSLGFLGDGGPATAAALNLPYAVTLDAAGDAYIADYGNSRIRKVSAATGLISTVAGGADLYPGDGGPATAALMNQPRGVALDTAGNIYATDIGRIRRVAAATGIVSTVAGNGNQQFSGDGGPATAAGFDAVDLAVDAAGNIYIADANGRRVRKVAATTGLISTVAGNGTGGFSGDGGPATAASLAFPFGLALDSGGNLYIADESNNRIRKVAAATGIISTIAGNGTRGFSGDGGPATAAEIGGPTRVAVAPSGDVLITDTGNSRIRRVSASSGVISTVAGDGTQGFSGDGGPATAAGFSLPFGVAVDNVGNVYVADYRNMRIRLVPACVTVVAPQLTAPAGRSTVGTPVKLTWLPVSGAFRYDVYLDRNPTSIAPTVTDLVSTSFVAGNLDPGTTYSWKVVAKGDPFCAPVSTAASEVRSFTTTGGCGAPGAFGLASPADGSSGVASQVALSWQAAPGAGTYDVFLGPSNPPALAASGVTGTSYSAPGLAAGATYSWSITAHASCDPTKTTTSQVRTFTVAGGCAAPGSFAPQSPSDGASGISSSPTLSWSPASGAASYDLYLGPTSTPPLYLSDLTPTNAVIAGLSAGTTYFWKVVARTSCNPNLTTTFPVRSFTVTGSCTVPQAPEILFAPATVGVGQTYVVAWRPAAGLDTGGGYVVERSLASGFSSVLDRQTTTATSASFLSSAVGQLFHRVRAIPGCDPTKAGPSSVVKLVDVVPGSPNVVFTVQPSPVVTTLGDRLEDQKTAFTIENITKAPVQVILSQAQLGSVPFFQIVDPFGGDTSFVTLDPSTPKTFELRFSGPPADSAGTYQGLVVVASTGAGLVITPYAFVNLKVGGSATVAPAFAIDGKPVEYTFFPGLSGDDTSRPPISVDVQNPGDTPMELGTEIGPEVWLEPEKGWNATPIPPRASRTLRLFTRRVRAPNGSALPRYTYLTLRSKSGQSARLLVQDNDAPSVAQGRTTLVDRGTRSYVVASVVRATSQIGNTFVTKLRLSNAGSDTVQADLFFTPRDADGFGTAVRRATVLVPRGDVVTLTDPLVQLFGLAPPVSGQLEVRSAPERIGFLTVTSAVDAPARTGGTFGFQMPTALRGEGAKLGSPHVITGITSTPSYRTNLILAETTGLDHAAVRAVLYDRDGNRKGDTLLDVPRYGQKQVAVTSLGASDSLDAGQIELTVESGSGAAVGLVTVIDNTNDDAVTYFGRSTAGGASSMAPSFLSRLARNPAWARAAGTVKLVVPAVVNGYPTFRDSGLPYTFQSLMGFSSGTGATATFRLTYQDLNTGQTLSRTVTVAPRSTHEFPNVLEELFGIPTGQKSQGPVFIEADPNGSVYCKVYSLLANGSLGDSFPVIPVPSESLTGSSSAKPVYVDGLEQSVDISRGTRSNLILNEVTGLAPATVVIRLYEAGNRSTPIAEQEIVLAAGEKKQLSTLFAGVGLESAERKKDRTNVQCVVTARSGSGLVSAVVTTIDNKTGDTKNAFLTPTGGVGAAGGGAIGF